MDNTILIMSVAACNEYCTIPNLYMCCKRLYVLWPYYRDRIALNEIEAHSEHYHDINAIMHEHSIYKLLQWGPIRLYCSGIQASEYTLCGVLHYGCVYNKCSNQYCKIYTAKLIAMNAYYQSYSLLAKYDIINNVRYAFITDSQDLSSTVKYMYDCSQIPRAHGYVRISVSSHMPGIGFFTIYNCSLTFVDPADHPNTNQYHIINDGQRAAISINHSNSIQFASFVTDNISNIIAYMRSPIIDSAQVLGQSFIDACKRYF